MQENKKNDFRDNISLKNRQDIFELKEKYENCEIFETDLTDEEIRQLIELYEEEERELDRDIAIRKARIKNLLKPKKT